MRNRAGLTGTSTRQHAHGAVQLGGDRTLIRVKSSRISSAEIMLRLLRCGGHNAPSVRRAVRAVGVCARAGIRACVYACMRGGDSRSSIVFSQAVFSRPAAASWLLLHSGREEPTLLEAGGQVKLDRPAGEHAGGLAHEYLPTGHKDPKTTKRLIWFGNLNP